MKVTTIPIVIGAFGRVTKGLVQELEDLEIRGRIETIQTTALLDRLEYWEESWRREKTCFYLESSVKLSGRAGVKNPQNNKNNNSFEIQTDLILVRRPDL